MKKKKIKPTDKYRKIKIILLSVLVIISLSLFFREKIILFILYPIGLILGYYSTIISKFIPHITAETMSIMSIVIGISYGASAAFMFGFVVSMLVYSLLGLIKLTTITNSAVIGFGGVVAALFVPISPFALQTSFMICLVFRAIIGIIVFWKITSDKLEAAAHAIIDPMFNMAIYMPIFFQILLFILEIKKG